MDEAEMLAVGTRVEVRNRFTRSWAGGFVVDGTSGRGYWVRRLNDGAVLPTCILGDDVRREAPPRRFEWQNAHLPPS